MSSEFEIIDQYFKKKMKQTLLGVGDDAAIIHIKKNREIVISSDMLVENVHFLKNTNPAHLGWKSLAVNLSDIAAMGAIPKWATLSIWILSCLFGFWDCLFVFLAVYLNF